MLRYCWPVMIDILLVGSLLLVCGIVCLCHFFGILATCFFSVLFLVYVIL